MEMESTSEVTKPKIRIVRRPNLADWSWEQVLSNYVPPTWGSAFARSAGERKTIAEVLTKKELPKYGELFPEKEKIYRAFELTPLPRVRVVIVGQDPYPQRAKNGLPKAQGLSFSVSPNDPEIPASLKNIYKELKAEYPETFTIPKHGDLSKWAKQGVLLLNMALTVAPGVRNAHKGVWKPFIYKIIKEIVEKYPQTIFVLWGGDAEKLRSQLGNLKALVSNHPSPESVNKGGNFMGNGHFLKINQILEERGEQPIDWQV